MIVSTSPSMAKTFVSLAEVSVCHTISPASSADLSKLSGLLVDGGIGGVAQDPSVPGQPFYPAHPAQLFSPPRTIVGFPSCSPPPFSPGVCIFVKLTLSLNCLASVGCSSHSQRSPAGLPSASPRSCLHSSYLPSCCSGSHSPVSHPRHIRLPPLPVS